MEHLRVEHIRPLMTIEVNFVNRSNPPQKSLKVLGQ